MTARWLWTDADAGPLDRWVLFRATLDVGPAGVAEGERTILRVCADARYQLRVNGGFLGEGPARSWPDELFYDEYEVGPLLREARTVELSLLVRHFTPGTTNYVAGEPGCAVELVRAAAGGETVLAVSDGTWECAVHPGFGEPTVKMSNGLGYGEVCRADLAADERRWDWRKALDRGPASALRRVVPRDIPLLEERIVPPAGVSFERLVRPVGFVRSVNLRPLVYPDDVDVNKHKRFSGILEFGIRCGVEAPGELGVTFDPHDTEPLAFFVDGRRLVHQNGRRFPVSFKKGITRVAALVRGEYHDPVFHFHFVLPEGAEPTPFSFRGPFTRTAHLQVSEPIPAAAVEVPSEEALAALGADPSSVSRPVPPYCVSSHHVALETLSSRPVELPDAECFVLADPASRQFPMRTAWEAGTSRQIAWDFGREVSGFIEFELRAAAGTRVDCFCFESMHDGMIEHAYSLNNSLRYVCSGSSDRYLSFARRGFRYVLMTLSGPAGNAEIAELRVRERLYPSAAQGGFSCSDPRLTRAWEISARTVSLCMEDTYVDCPAYEQTYWTGDARNTALYSYYLFNAGPLFLRCARLAARSLERSPLIESTVPSSWQNVIPSWSFFHVLAGVEYRFHSGDEAGFASIYPSLFATLSNAAERRVGTGGGRLFAMHAWNMVDWAPMDVGDDVIPAHQNAQFVTACKALAGAARETGRPEDAARLDEWARETAESFDRLFWSEAAGAYRDSLSREGAPSPVFSVQTQLFAYLAGVGSEARRERLRELILQPPDGFVRIGSPFVRHFLYELLVRWNRLGLVLEEMGDVWGAMIDKGATTCWEGWLFIPGHHTRSHCHAWSAAPSYFLPTIVLGIRPEAPGFARVAVKPYPGKLSSAEGGVPTPLGLLSVSWRIDGGAMRIEVEKPKAMAVRVEVPEGFPDCAVVVRDRA